jgi:hypothetical protein
MRSFVILAAVICCLFAVTSPGLTATSEQRSRSVLDGVKELEKPVTYTETKIPLGELVRKVAKETGAPLTAAKEVADEPVTVVVKAFSARELLVQLADLLDYTWSRRGQSEGVRERESEGRSGRSGSSPSLTPNAQRPTPVRYEIYQDLGGKQREEALRRAVTADTERQFRADLAGAVELAALTPEQFQRVRDDWYKRYAELRKLPAPADALLEFFRSTYAAAADLGGWPRADLER